MTDSEIVAELREAMSTANATGTILAFMGNTEGLQDLMADTLDTFNKILWPSGSEDEVHEVAV